jgi:hypothetical protein
MQKQIFQVSVITFLLFITCFAGKKQQEIDIELKEKQKELKIVEALLKDCDTGLASILTKMNSKAGIATLDQGLKSIRTGCTSQLAYISFLEDDYTDALKSLNAPIQQKFQLTKVKFLSWLTKDTAMFLKPLFIILNPTEKTSYKNDLNLQKILTI